jgi:nucleotide-binding universal stress UspA family protein
MSELRDGPVVVGFDASSAARRAMRAAAVEAAAAGVDLVVVHVYSWPILYASLTNIPFAPEQWSPSEDAVALAESGAELVGRTHPELKVTVSVPVGRAGEQLVAASANASLLVIGATGASGLRGLLAGSVTSYVTSHAHCPVMVVRGAGPADRTVGEVCVGVDGTPSSLDALRFAASWARDRGATLRALYAIDGDADPAARGLLLDWVAQSLGDDVPVDAVVVARSAASALVAATSAARLVVVGAHHQGLVHGSVGHTLIRRAACPVVVVPCRAVAAVPPGATHVPGGAR